MPSSATQRLQADPVDGSGCLGQGLVRACEQFLELFPKDPRWVAAAGVSFTEGIIGLVRAGGDGMG